MTLRGRTTSTSHGALFAAATLALTLLGAPAVADWLVMKDGTNVETDGAWAERGKLVVFTDTQGKLVSLRLSEVDLAASHQATADAVEAANRPAPLPPPPQESVYKLTDADVGHVDAEDEADADESAAATGEAEVDAPAVTVIGWESSDSGADGVQIRATLENQGEDVAVGLAVAVTIFADDGEALSTTTAQLTSTGLVPGETTELIADFPGFFEFTAVNFDVQHRSIATRSTDDVPTLEDAFGTEG